MQPSILSAQSGEFPFLRKFLPPISDMLKNLNKNITISLSEILLFDERPAPVVQVTAERYYQADAVANYFTEEIRISCSRNASITPLAFFQARKPPARLELRDRSLLSFRDCLPAEKRHLLLLREYIYNSVKECNNFNTTLAVFILNRLGAKRVLDPSAGWGDRALACLASGTEYLGFDPNTQLAEGYAALAALATSRGVNCQFVNAPFDLLEEDYLEKLGYFSTVITSPPYFDLEIYGQEIGQSVQRFRTYPEWINGFLRPYLNKSFDRLEIGGNYAIYIEDVRTMALTEEVYKIFSERPDTLYRGVIGFSHSGGAVRPTFVWSRTALSSRITEGLFTTHKPEYNPPVRVESYIIPGKDLKVPAGRDLKVNVLREDLLPGGTKQRALVDYLLRSNCQEFVYAGPETGFGQVALAVSAKITGKRATIFVSHFPTELGRTESPALLGRTESPALLGRTESPEKTNQSNIGPITQLAKQYGAKTEIFIPGIRLVDLENRALRYLAEEFKKGRNICNLPFGFHSDEIIAILTVNLREALKEIPPPRRLWMVTGSGTILKSFAAIWPSTEYQIVRAGKQIPEEVTEGLRCRLYPPNDVPLPQKFEDPAPILPPYPSVRTYDAKLWQYVLQFGENDDFILNVAADPVMSS